MKDDEKDAGKPGTGDNGQTAGEQAGSALALLPAAVRDAIVGEVALALQGQFDAQVAKLRVEVARGVESAHQEAAQEVHRVKYSAAARLNDGIALINDMPIPPDLTCLPPLPEPVRAWFARYSTWIEFRRREYGAIMEAPPDDLDPSQLPKPVAGGFQAVEGGPTISRWGR